MIFLRCCVLARGRGHGVKLHYISALYYDAPQCLGEFWLKTWALRDFLAVWWLELSASNTGETKVPEIPS